MPETSPDMQPRATSDKRTPSKRSFRHPASPEPTGTGLTPSGRKKPFSMMEAKPKPRPHETEVETEGAEEARTRYEGIESSFMGEVDHPAIIADVVKEMDDFFMTKKPKHEDVFELNYYKLHEDIQQAVMEYQKRIDFLKDKQRKHGLTDEERVLAHDFKQQLKHLEEIFIPFAESSDNPNQVKQDAMDAYKKYAAWRGKSESTRLEAVQTEAQEAKPEPRARKGKTESLRIIEDTREYDDSDLSISLDKGLAEMRSFLSAEKPTPEEAKALAEKLKKVLYGYEGLLSGMAKARTEAAAANETKRLSYLKGLGEDYILKRDGLKQVLDSTASGQDPESIKGAIEALLGAQREKAEGAVAKYETVREQVPQEAISEGLREREKELRKEQRDLDKQEERLRSKISLIMLMDEADLPARGRAIYGLIEKGAPAAKKEEEPAGFWDKAKRWLDKLVAKEEQAEKLPLRKRREAKALARELIGIQERQVSVHDQLMEFKEYKKATRADVEAAKARETEIEAAKAREFEKSFGLEEGEGASSTTEASAEKEETQKEMRASGPSATEEYGVYKIPQRPGLAFRKPKTEKGTNKAYAPLREYLLSQSKNLGAELPIDPDEYIKLADGRDRALKEGDETAADKLQGEINDLNRKMNEAGLLADNEDPSISIPGRSGIGRMGAIGEGRMTSRLGDYAKIIPGPSRTPELELTAIPETKEVPAFQPLTIEWAKNMLGGEAANEWTRVTPLMADKSTAAALRRNISRTINRITALDGLSEKFKALGNLTETVGQEQAFAASPETASYIFLKAFSKEKTSNTQDERAKELIDEAIHNIDARLNPPKEPIEVLTAEDVIPEEPPTIKEAAPEEKPDTLKTGLPSGMGEPLSEETAQAILEEVSAPPETVPKKKRKTLRLDQVPRLDRLEAVFTAKAEKELAGRKDELMAKWTKEAKFHINQKINDLATKLPNAYGALVFNRDREAIKQRLDELMQAEVQHRQKDFLRLNVRYMIEDEYKSRLKASDYGQFMGKFEQESADEVDIHEKMMMSSLEELAKDAKAMAEKHKAAQIDQATSDSILEELEAKPDTLKEAAPAYETPASAIEPIIEAGLITRSEYGDIKNLVPAESQIPYEIALIDYLKAVHEASPDIQAKADELRKLNRRFGISNNDIIRRLMVLGGEAGKAPLVREQPKTRREKKRAKGKGRR